MWKIAASPTAPRNDTPPLLTITSSSHSPTITKVILQDKKIYATKALVS